MTYCFIHLVFYASQFLFFSCECYGQAGFPKNVDHLLQEFDKDNPLSYSDGDESAQKERLFRADFSGYIKSGVVVTTAHGSPLPGETDWRGVSSFRTDVFTRVKLKFSDRFTAIASGTGYYDAVFSIRGRGNYTDELLDSSEKDFEPGEACLQGTLFRNLDISVGRQFVVWGTSDYIRVTDVLNPLDLREPGLTSLEDLRLPVALTQVRYYWSDVSITGVLVHEYRLDKYPVYGSDFYPFNINLPYEKSGPRQDSVEWGMALKWVRHQWELSFYLARVINDRPYVETLNLFNPGESIMNHAKIHMTGIAVQRVTGNWLFKAETAYLDGFRLYQSPGISFSRWDLFLGVEYFGVKNMHISAEAVNRHLNHWALRFEQFPDYIIKDDFQVVFKVSKTLYNDALTLTFIGSLFGIDAKNGSFQQYTLDYKINDVWSLQTGMIDYRSGDKIELKNTGKNDRLFFKLKYSF